MKVKTQNEVRTQWLKKIMLFLQHENEDVGIINSNTCNFPIVVDDEEAWIEIVIKIPKDDGDEGYLKREDYQIKCKEKEERQKKKEKEKEKKIEKDRKLREQKRLERELRKS